MVDEKCSSESKEGTTARIGTEILYANGVNVYQVRSFAKRL